MKILHINYCDVSGGAARAVMRLHEGLLSLGVDSKILTVTKESDLDTVIESSEGIIPKILRSKIDKLPTIFYRKKRTKFSTAIINDTITDYIKKNTPDLIHFHWVNDGQLSLSALSKITQPFVWSFLDMWPFTGGCHYSNGCIKYMKECGSCPVLGSKMKNDISSYQLKIKKKVYKKLNIRVVAISSWLKTCIEKSSIFSNHNVELIYPGINLDRFRPLNKEFCREMFLLPKNKKLILFGALNSTSDTRKGFEVLLQAIKEICKSPISNNFEIVVFGATSSSISHDLPVKINFVGKLKSGFGIFDDVALASLYSTADITVIPSLEEAFGQTASESLACGVPVVGFRNTGLEDIIDHLSTGYLAENNSSKDLATGILETIKLAEDSSTQYKCVKKAQLNFDIIDKAKQYMCLYEIIRKQ